MSSVSESISLDKIASENKNDALQSEIERKQKAIDTNAAFGRRERVSRKRPSV